MNRIVRLLALGTATLGLGASLTACGPTLADLPLPGTGVSGDTITVKMDFADALNLAKGATVKVNGVSEGKVESIDAADFQAVAVTKIRTSAELRQGATARLRYTTPLGELFVDITNPASGALLAQFEVDNPKGELLPGAYAEVHLPMDNHSHTMTVPATVLIFRAQGPQVAVLGADGKVQLRDVHIALDLGDRLQIDRGLQAGERIVNHPSDSLMQGDRVQVAKNADTATGTAKAE